LKVLLKEKVLNFYLTFLLGLSVPFPLLTKVLILIKMRKNEKNMKIKREQKGTKIANKLNGSAKFLIDFDAKAS
jgi:hypothetical protein